MPSIINRIQHPHELPFGVDLGGKMNFFFPLFFLFFFFVVAYSPK